MSIILLVSAVFAAGCGSDPEAEPDPRGLAVYDALERGGVVYASGSFRYPENAAGNHLVYGAFLLILDAADPTHPEVVEVREMKLTRPGDIVGGKLVMVQSGYDEENLPGPGQPGSPAPQNVRVKVFGLSDPFNPQLEKTIELPGSASREVGFFKIDEDTILLSSDFTTYSNPDGETFGWVVKPGAAPGFEVVATSTYGCAAPFVRGNRLWCLNTASLYSDPAAWAFNLPLVAGSIVPVAQAPLPDNWMAGQSELTSADDVVTFGRIGGVRRLRFDAFGIPVLQNSVDFEGTEAGILSAGQAGLLVQTKSTIRLADPVTLAGISELRYPGEPYTDHGGGSGLRRFGGASSRLYLAALGDYGVLIFRLSGTTLEKVGGYYKRFGTNWASDDQLQEGHY